MNRAQLIDYIDSYYNEDYEVVERIMENVYGHDIYRIEQDASQDFDYDVEGFYAAFRNTDLKEIAEELDSYFMNKLNIELKISEEELKVLIDAMENYSKPSFTKDSMMSKVAQRLLTRLHKI